MYSAKANEFNYLIEMHFSFLKSKALQVIAETNIADVMTDTPQSIESLVQQHNESYQPHIKQVQKLKIIMEILASHKVFQVSHEGLFSHSEYSYLIKSDHPRSIKKLLIKENDNERWAAYNAISQSLYDENNTAAFELSTGESYYQYLENNSAARERFDQGMSQFSEFENQLTAEALTITGKTVIDIGGGKGDLVSRISQKYPEIQVDLFDLPETVKGRLPNLKKSEVFNGSFLEAIHIGRKYELVLLKRVIHNWGDQDCVRILKNIKPLLKEGGEVIVLDALLENKGPSVVRDAQMIDLLMNGKERNYTELDQIAKDAGFVIKQEGIKSVGPFIKMIPLMVS